MKSNRRSGEVEQLAASKRLVPSSSRLLAFISFSCMYIHFYHSISSTQCTDSRDVIFVTVGTNGGLTG